MPEPQPEELLGELCRQPDLQSARDFLAGHPGLVDETLMRILYMTAQGMTDRKLRERLQQYSDLMQKALEKGLDAAYQEMAAAAPRRLQGFELVQLGSQFLAAEDDAAVALLQQYAEFPVEATLAMAQAMASRTSPEEKQKLEKRIALLKKWATLAMAEAMQAAQRAEERYRSQPGLETFREMAQATEAVAASPGMSVMEPKMRADLLSRDSSVHFSLWRNTYDSDALDLAITRGTQAATLVPGAGADILAVALIERYESRGTAEDLDSCIKQLEGAFPDDKVPGDNLQQAALATNLANALRHRHIVTGVVRDADRAVALYEQLAELPVPEPERRRLRLVNLSSGLMARYDGVGNLADLKRAIDISQSCLQEMADDDPGKPTLANNLGMSLMKRFVVTKDRNDLATAQGALVLSVKLTPPGSPELPRNLSNLGSCLLMIYNETKKPEMLDAAVDALLEALRRVPQGSSEAANKMLAASDALATRFAVSNKKADIDHAVDLAQNAVKSVLRGSGLYHGALAQLARVLRTRSGSKFKRKDDRAQGFAHYREAVQGALADVPMITVEAGIQWGAWARERKQWDEAAEAFLLAMDAHQKILDSQQDRLSRELRLKRIQGLGAMAASSLLHAGQTGKALVAIERGRGLLAAQALKRRPDEVTFLSVTEKISDHPLVYLEDVDGGYGVLVQDGIVQPLSFPKLREETINQWLEKNFSFRQDDPARWQVELGFLCRWLWDAVIGPLIDALRPWDEVTLVPCGYLGMLPLHAAWKEDPSRPSGRFYAADALTIRYAPSAASLRPEAPDALASILCVDEPAPVKAPRLPFSKAEVEAAAAGFATKKTLRKKLATRAALLEEIPDYNVLHLSCHGRANLDEPLENGFLMAGGEFLTLRDLFGVDMSNITLAVLSACDTGQMGTGLPDEAISLPAGMLAAGVKGIVSPLWPIDSFTALLFVARFYECLGREKPPQALQTAQRWLRDTTNAEKAAHFKNRPALWSELRLREPELREQSAITEWAAFCYNGA